MITHQKFDPKTFEYDLALLRFHEPVKFQPNIVPICIPEEDRNMVGQRAWVTGWGRLYEGRGFWPHCKDTIAKIRNEYSQKRNWEASVPMSNMSNMSNVSASDL